jgi:hypothetical protein
MMHTRLTGFHSSSTLSDLEVYVGCNDDDDDSNAVHGKSDMAIVPFVPGQVDVDLK